jgi:alpha-amylase
MKKHLFTLAVAALFIGQTLSATNDYGIPDDIQQGNILHCFNWKISDVKAELQNIAEAGFGSVQLSPLQRNVSSGWSWADPYRPYDFCFVSSAFGTADELKELCEAAADYGIKIIVDVVANHVDSGSYHDSWWDSDSRLRSNGSIDYSNRYSITHNQLGSYPDVNSENADVQARAKAYIEELKSYGVKGIRWDAAKHIALPSESCAFWSTVTSVSGMYNYGEILDNPGGSDATALMKEYTNYMSVTDNGYGNGARYNDGCPSGYAGWAAGTLDESKVVYWGESHDTYANSDGDSKNVDQAVVDRAYAIVACRKGATALYLSRPSATAYADIKVAVKGSTHFTSKQVAEVNKFRNAMVGLADYYTTSDGVSSVTRKGGGAVIVKKGGAGSVSIANGGGYAKTGTYTDRVSGNTFTVTSTTITGTVGSTGIAVIYDDETTPDPEPEPDPEPDPEDPYPTALYLAGNVNSTAWSTSAAVAADTAESGVYTWNSVTLDASSSSSTNSYFTFLTTTGSSWEAVNKADRYGATSQDEAITSTATIKLFTGDSASGAYSWKAAAGTYKIVADLTSMTLTISTVGNVDPDPDPEPVDEVYVFLKNTSSWSTPCVWAWNDSGNQVSATSWPGDKMTLVSGDIWRWDLPSGKSEPTLIIFSNNGNSQSSQAGHTFQNGKTYDCSGNIVEEEEDTYPDMLYLAGKVNDTDWSTSAAVAAATAKSGVYTWSGVKLSGSSDDPAYGTFTLLTTTGDDWDAVNAADRYGAGTKHELVTSTSTIVKYPVNVSASGAQSWMAAVGYYDITADLTTMTLTITKTGDVPVYPAKIYLVGTINGTNWAADKAVAAGSASDGVYVWNNVTFNKADNKADNGYAYFTLVTAPGTSSSDWDTVNLSDRYGSTTADESITSTAPIKLFEAGDAAKSAFSWKTAPGVYEVEADLTTMTLTITKTGELSSSSIYLMNTAGWTKPCVWAWNDNSSNLTGSSSFPGDAMTNVEGDLWQWDLPAGNDMPSSLIISDNGSTSIRFQANYVSGRVYTNSGAEYTYPTLYMVGTINGTSWDTANGLLPTSSELGTYVWDSVAMNGSSSGTAYFSFITALDSTAGEWNNANKSDRYGAVDDDSRTLVSEQSIKKYAYTSSNNQAGSAKSWKVAAGTYRVTANLNTMKVSLSVPTGVEAVETETVEAEAEYYNLQGVRVVNPTHGIYIVRRGAKVTKEIIR